nr:MAG TPA: hypothetical protein [Caudoviricetes sp.]
MIGKRLISTKTPFYFNLKIESKPKYTILCR